MLLYNPPTAGLTLYSYDYARKRSRFLKFLAQENPRLRTASTDTALVQQFMRLDVTSLEADARGTVTVVVQAYSPQIKLIKTRDIKTATGPGKPIPPKAGIGTKAAGNKPSERLVAINFLQLNGAGLRQDRGCCRTIERP